MAVDMKPVQVRLSEEAHAALKLLADVEDKDLGEKARELLTRCLLGDVHAAKVAAERFARAVKTAKPRQSAVADPNQTGLKLA